MCQRDKKTTATVPTTYKMKSSNNEDNVKHKENDYIKDGNTLVGLRRQPAMSLRQVWPGLHVFTYLSFLHPADSVIKV